MTGFNHSSRRTVLQTSAALAGSGLALGGYTILASDDAQAAVTLDTFDVPDANLDSPDGIPADIFVSVSGDYTYKVPEVPASVRVMLYHRDTGGGFHAIATATTADHSNTDGSGTFDLFGSLFDAGHYVPEDFRAPGPNKNVIVNVEMGVLLQVLDADEAILADGRATRVVSISVTETALSARVGADGAVLFQEDTDDATPTP